MVRMEGVEPSSQPWEGYILAVIRHPPALPCIASRQKWSHLGDSNPGPPLYESGALAN